MVMRPILELTINKEPPTTGRYLTDFQRNLLQESLKQEHRKIYRTRIEIMLLTDEGLSQTAICKALQCAPETARYWITMTKMGLAHLWNEKLVGRPKKINEFHLTRLRELIAHNPRDYGYSYNRWTGEALSKHLAEEFQINVSPRHLNRLLKTMDFSPQENNHVNTQLTIRTPGGIILKDLTPVQD